MAQEEQKFNRVVSIRLVDASFESPNKMALQGKNEVPVITQKQEGPVITKVNDEGVYNVKLTLTVTCDFEDKTNVFIAEAKQVATVLVPDADDLASQIFLNGTVADILYNSLRELVNDLITSGGFPEFHVQFLSYEQKYLLDNADKFKAANEAKPA